MNELVTATGDKIHLVVYPMDTQETLENRAAFALNTLPQWLHLSPAPLLDPQEVHQVEAINLRAVAEHFPDLRLVVDKTDFAKYFPVDEIVGLWLAYHPTTPKNAYADRPEWRLSRPRETAQDIRRKVSAFKREQQSIQTRFHRMSKLPADPSATELVQTQAVMEFRLPVGARSLTHVFDRIPASPSFPLLRLGPWIKVLTGDCRFDSVWMDTQPDQIHLAVPGNDESVSVWTIREESSEFVITGIRSGGDENDFDAKVREIVSALREPVPEGAIAGVSYQFEVSGVLDVLLFSDFLLNSQFRDWLSMNDRVAVAKRFGARTFFFQHPHQPSRIVNINLRQVDGSKILFTLIRAPTRRASNLIRFLLLRAVHAFRGMQDELTEAYREFGLSRALAPRKKVSKSFMKNIDPEIFDGNYSRKCQSGRVPAIIGDQEAADTDEQVMRFPKEGGVFTPRNFVCRNEKYRFPGLVANPESTLKFQPCCFLRDQRQSRNYKAYFEGAARVEPKSQTYMKTTKKRALFGERSMFPGGGALSTLLAYGMGNEETVFRQGMDPGPSTFLQCVLYALDLSDQRNPDAGVRAQKLQTARKQLLANVVPEFLAQENVGMTSENIREMVTGDGFLDPARTIRLLEHVFQVNLLVLVQNPDHPQGGFLQPRHTYGHFRYRRNAEFPTIVLFAHLGAESDALAYAHCELVQRDLNAPQGVFDTSDPSTATLWDIHDRSQLGFSGPFPLVKTLLKEVVAQRVDAYGKVRAVTLRLNGRDVAVETSPLPPMNVAPLEAAVGGISIEDASELAVALGAVEMDVVERAGKTVRVQWVADNTEFGVSVESQQPEWVLRQFAESERDSRKLVNWTLFLFSERWAQSGKSLESAIDEFESNGFEIEEDPDYANVPAVFNPAQAEGMIRNGKVVCSSQEDVDGLMFQLERWATRDAKGLKEYHKREFMERFYTSPDDFEQTPVSRVLENRDRSDILSLFREPKRVLRSQLDPEIRGPYFLRVGDTVYLTENTQSLDVALASAETFIREGYHELSAGRAPESDQFGVFAPGGRVGIVGGGELTELTPRVFGNDGLFGPLHIL